MFVITYTFDVLIGGLTSGTTIGSGSVRILALKIGSKNCIIMKW